MLKKSKGILKLKPKVNDAINKERNELNNITINKA